MTDPVHPDQPYTPSTDWIRILVGNAATHAKDIPLGMTPEQHRAHWYENFDRWLADHDASVRRDAQADALKGELTEFRKRVQQAFEWPNPELAMQVLAKIEFLMISERFPIAAAIRRNENGEQG
jgi:hypothetical protein